MANCIIRKLKETVSTEDLYPIDAICITIPNAYEARALFSIASSNSRVYCYGDLKMSPDNTYTTEVDEWVLNDSGLTKYIYYKGTGKIIITNKYNITRLDLNAGHDPGEYNQICNTTDFYGMKNLTYFANDINTFGDISVFYDCKFIEFIISNNGISTPYIDTASYNTLHGDAIPILNNTSQRFTVRGQDIELDLSRIIYNDKLKYLFVDACSNVYGNLLYISNNYPNLVDLTFKACTTISGDVSSLPASVCFFSNKVTTQGALYWGNGLRRVANNGYFIALEGVYLGDTVDNMLIEQAQLNFRTSGQFYGAESVTYKKIYVYGSRTSASDSALQTLKDKGVTIALNGTFI